MGSKIAGKMSAGSERSEVGTRRSNLYLVGFMGSGKTSVGRRLAELLGWTFLDLDEEIEKREGKPIPEIFRLRGEKHFRSLERQELGRASQGGRTVVAVGGGTFCSVENQEIITRTGISIWLDAPIELLFARCSASPALRPLFTGMDEMTKLLERRLPSYAQAKARVPVGSLSIDELAKRILAEIKQHEAPSYP
jgi:shikimate kinase